MSFDKEFLSYPHATLNYMMYILRELTPVTNTWLSEHVKSPMLDREINNYQKRFASKNILSTLKQKPGLTEYFTVKDIDGFRNICIKICKILQQKYPVQDLTKMDLEAYNFYIQKINNAKWLSTDTQAMALTVAESLRDYSETITIIIQCRKNILENELTKMESSQLEDFYKSLYGSMFALICIMTSILTESVKHTNTSVLTGIINQGYQLAQNLDSYTDTLDIMTNPKELELLKKSELEV